MKDNDALALVQDRLSFSKKFQSEEFAEAVEYDRLYNNVIDETESPFLSNICLPWPYIIIESYLGKCIQVMAAALPYCRVVEEDDEYRDQAKRVEKDANMVLYKQKWPIFAYNAYKQAFKYGTAFVLEKPWGIVGREEMPIFVLLDYFDVYYNPNSLTLDDDDAYIIVEQYIPLRAYKKFKDNREYKNLSRIVPHDGEIRNEYQKAIDENKDIPERPSDPHSQLVKQWLYFDHENIIIVTNGNNVIRNSRNFMDGHIPIKVFKPIPLEDRFTGMSILKQGKGLFVEANENRNQYNDAVWLMLNPHWIVDRGAGLHKGTIVARAGGITYMDDINGLKPMPVDWNILPQALSRATMIERDIQNYSNAFPQMRGQPGISQGTATGDIMIRQAGELRSDTYNLLLAMMSIEDIIADIVKFKKMFMTRNSNFYYWPEGRIERATPEDYEGEFTFKAIAGYKQAREIERKHMIEAMTLIFGNQAFLPLVMPKANEWLERLLDYFDIRSPEQLHVTDEETAANALIQQIKQLQQAGVPNQPQQIRQLPALGEKEMRMEEQTPNVPLASMLGNLGEVNQ